MIREIFIRLAFALFLALTVSAICRYLTGSTCLPLSFMFSLIFFVSGPPTLRYALHATLTLLMVAWLSYVIDWGEILVISILGVVMVLGLWIWLMWVGVVERWNLLKGNGTTQ